jgi:hypothetical protein
MATKTIGQLTQATTINNADEFAIEQSGVTKRVAASVVRGDIVNANIKSDAAIALSKLATGALPTAITVAQANLVTALVNALVPVGTVQSFARSTAPTGWLAANGDTIGSASSNATNASADYSALFTLLWDNWTNTDLPILDSAGAASTRGANAAADFAANKRLPLPDLRGIFVRGSGSQAISGTTYNKTFATKERDALQNISGTINNVWAPSPSPSGAFTSAASGSSNRPATGGNGSVDITFQASNSSGARTDTETRPANIALLYCIKF